MADVREKANKIALELTNKYQNIRYEEIATPVPYFINTAEQEYKTAMGSAGIGVDYIKKVIELIKSGQTVLGSSGGKGSPQEIEEDLCRLIPKLKETGFILETQQHIRRWMKVMHTGLDCSGYVFNVLKCVEDDLKVGILNTLAWADPEMKKPSHAGAFIFDSDNLETINDFNFKPLDILVFKDHVHVGIMLDVGGILRLADCSMSDDGITFRNTSINKRGLSIVDSPGWNRNLSEGNIIFKRLKL